MCDIQMPVMDGFQACRIIKNTNPNTPVIALTANVMESDLKRYAEEGFDACLPKPMDMKDLYRVTDSFLKKAWAII